MPYPYSKPIFRFLYLFLLLSFSIFLFSINSCKREFSIERNGAVGTDIMDGIQGTAHLQGFIFDENNQPVAGATVKTGRYTAVTNTYGIFYFSNISTSLHNTVLTVIKPGYFTQVKSMMIMEGKDNFIKAQLIPKVLVKTVDAAVGGEIALTSGAKLVLPAAGMVNKSNGSVYDGKVNVYMAWMDPSQYNILYQMPGDLRGVTQDDNERMLITYGMMKVELESSSNQPLQLASGKKASMVFPVPSALQGEAPASVPMWYFDEQKGRWIEEGSATYKGNHYQTDVSHFTDWNVDVPYPEPLIRFCLVVVDENDKPYANSHVLIRRPNDNWGAHGYTNGNGYLCGWIPAKTPLKLEILGEPSCEQALLSTPIGPFNTSVDLDTILVRRNPEKTITVSGTAVDCDNKPVTDGYVQGTIRTQGFIGKITNGKFEFTMTRCPGDKTIKIFGVDLVKDILSPEKDFHITGNEIRVGKLMICGDPSKTIENSLMAYYPFDGNVNDYSGNALNGVVTGMLESVADHRGNPGKAYHFTTDSRIQISNSEDKKPYPMTLSIWFNIDTDFTLASGNLFSKYSTASWNGFYFKVNSYSPNTTTGWVFMPSYMNSLENNTSGEFGQRWFDAPIEKGKWNHAVYVVNDIGAKIYMNNVLIDSKEWKGTAKPLTSDVPWFIGSSPMWEGGIKGSLDEIRVYNRSLTESEIKVLYQK